MLFRSKDKNINLNLKDKFRKNISISPQKWLRDEIEAVKEGAPSRPWQNVLASLYTIVPKLWKILDEEGRKTFLTKYYSFWMIYLAAFPLENAKKILTLLEEEKVEILGGLESVSFADETQQFTIICADRDELVADDSDQSHKYREIKAKYLINATGQGHDITQTDSLLLNNLWRKNLIVPHPFGGIKVHFRSLQVAFDNPSADKAVPIFVVGDGGTWGTCMATADLGQVAKQAQRVVYSIAKTLFFHAAPTEDRFLGSPSVVSFMSERPSFA